MRKKLEDQANAVALAVAKMGGAVKVGERYGVSDNAVYKWIWRGNINHLKFSQVIDFARWSEFPLDKLTGIEDVALLPQLPKEVAAALKKLNGRKRTNA
jgi:hypothetical protein